VLGVLALLVAAVAPLAAVAAVGAVVEEIPGVAAAGLDSPSGHSALRWAVAAGGCLLLQWAAGALQGAVAGLVGERVDALLQRELMDAVMRPEGIGHLEDPETLDLLAVGRETFRSGWARPGRLAASLGGLAAGRLTLLGAALLVAGFNPVLGGVLLLVALWAAQVERSASRTEAAQHYGSSETARRLEYYYELGGSSPAGKEVRVFGLSGFLVDRYSAAWRHAMTGVLGPLPRRPVLAAAALAAVVLGGLGLVAAEAAGGGVAAGPAAVCAQALMLSLTAMKQSAWTGLQTELALGTLRRFTEATAAVGGSAAPEPAGGGRAAEGLPVREIRFAGVGFRYPGARTAALHGLDLVLPAGRSLAVVGVNGAGKSTLVKLLTRMYRPDAGRITVDGISLDEFDAAAWRRQLAAVFQDSAHFAVPAGTAVAFGRIEAAEDTAGIEAAAARAGIAEHIGSLPRGWATTLSAEYAQGTDLSGGQWQKLALARALFAVRHGARVLILDEPAAHLDARAEAELYEDFLQLTEGLTTVVISHRFSTVRRADSIAVLDAGGVVEQGSHQELLDRGGPYAEMFRLQAARFAEPEADSAEQQEVGGR
jgi:ATP-binding cassette subfamily B protein